MRPVTATAELDTLLRTDSGAAPTLLDVRWRLAGPPGIDAYRHGHLPGAVFLDVDADLAGHPGVEGRHPLPDPEVLQRTLRAAGVPDSGLVVVYDDGNSSVAARAWWLLRWAGHEEVAVLDGGFAAWKDEGRPVTAEVPRPAEGDIVVRPGSMPVLDADAAAHRARSGLLLDARAPGRYTGAEEPIDPRAGHIPGARNAPFTAHVDDQGRWRSSGELARHFAELGVEPGTPVGAYCGSGVTACSIVLALELAGHPDPAALYAGSWSNWVADARREAVIGHEPG